MPTKTNPALDNADHLKVVLNNLLGQEGFRADLLGVLIDTLGTSEGLSVMKNEAAHVFRDLVKAIKGDEGMSRTARLILTQGMPPDARVAASQADLNELEKVASDKEARGKLGAAIGEPLLDLLISYGKLYIPGL